MVLRLVLQSLPVCACSSVYRVHEVPLRLLDHQRQSRGHVVKVGADVAVVAAGFRVEFDFDCLLLLPAFCSSSGFFAFFRLLSWIPGRQFRLEKKLSSGSIV